MWKFWIKTPVAFAGGALAMHMVRQAQENNVRFPHFLKRENPNKADPIELLFISVSTGGELPMKYGYGERALQCGIDR